MLILTTLSVILLCVVSYYLLFKVECYKERLNSAEKEIDYLKEENKTFGIRFKSDNYLINQLRNTIQRLHNEKTKVKKL